MRPALRFQGLFVLSAVVLLTATAFSQPRRMSPTERTNDLKAKLELTAAQTDSVRAIYEVADSTMRAVFQSAGGDRSAMRDRMMAIRDSTDKKIELLLTGTQKEKFAAYKKERDARRGFGPGGDRPRRPNND